MHCRLVLNFAALSFAIIPFISAPPPPQPDAAAIIRDLDAANQARYEHVVSFSDVEHYAVFRGKDQAHSAAEMTVRDTYKKGVGKTYEILAQSGSEWVLKYGLHPLLENEKTINDPATVSQSWFTSANYEMHIKPGVSQMIDGRECLAFSITPRHKAANMIEGTLWIDAQNHILVEVEGIASRSPSIFAGTTKMMRRYTNLYGYAMARNARAESSSMLFGKTVVTIEYSEYHLALRTQP